MEMRKMEARVHLPLVELRFEENFAAALIAAIFHRREQQCWIPDCKKDQCIPAPFFAGAKGRYTVRL